MVEIFELGPHPEKMLKRADLKYATSRFNAAG
jgi:hypothetical protein